jgi:threonine dehydratase
LARGERVKIGVPKTIADGLQTTSPSELTFGLAREHGCEIVTVSDDELKAAVAFVFERMKLVVEPSGAAAIAALLTGRIPGLAGKRVGAIFSGGNADPSRFASYL